MYITRWSTCRFCRQTADNGYMVKYGTRHYAHFSCYLDAGKQLSDLHTWQVQKFPYKLLKERGLLDQVRAQIDASPVKLARVTV